MFAYKQKSSIFRMSAQKSFPCCVCNKRTKPNERRNITGDQNKLLRKYLFKNFLITITNEDVICLKCRNKYNRNRYSITPENVHIETVEPATKKSCFTSPRNIKLPLSSVGGGHSTCLVCKRRGPKLVVASSNARYYIFVHKEIIIPAGSRCCPSHLSDDVFTEDAIKLIGNSRDNTDFNKTDILSLIKKMREMILKTDDKHINFDTGSLSESDYINLTGISQESFANLSSYLTSVRDTCTRSSRTCLGIFLTKLRSGLSNRVLSTIFNVSQHSIRRAVASCRKNLLQVFVPENLGFQHVTRQQVIENHTRPLAQTIFGDLTKPAILVIDGTYIYIQKSSQFEFQRRSYSMHKHRPLVKPMVFVSTSGYFVSVMGPYLADGKNNDASIMKHIIAHDLEAITDWLEEDDVFVVDRGFRDSIDILNEIGVHTEMPSFLKKGQKQLTVEESNTSRLVTKIRWVVESANGRIKNWKYMDKVVPNSQIPYIGDYVKIICAICNKYMKPLSSGDEEEDLLLGSKLKYLAKQNNALMQKVIDEGMDKITSRSVNWKNMDVTDINFPKLTEEDLRNLTLGVYQVGLAKSYTIQHLNGGDYCIRIHGMEQDLLCAKLDSRHTSAKHYLLWIKFDECAVIGWYCKCRTGTRVVGMCAHISSVVWYLGYARHLDKPFQHGDDWTKYLADAKNMPEPESVDESDNDDQVEEE